MGEQITNKYPAMTHVFGGSWTDLKLDVMERYLTAYATALKRKRFRRVYVDPFAGSGDRIDSSRRDLVEKDLLSDDVFDVPVVKKGSAAIALDVEPHFGHYLFADRSPAHVASLRRLREKYADRSIEVRQADANATLRDFVEETDWTRTRAVVFIDPYGMQLEWTTLETVAKTRAIDAGILFPTGIALNRVVRNDGKLPRGWERSLDKHLGDCDWRSAFYKQDESPSLFEVATPSPIKAVNIAGFADFLLERLKSVFPHVHSPLPLTSGAGLTLFHLFIVCANPDPKAGALAMRLAAGSVRAGLRSLHGGR